MSYTTTSVPTGAIEVWLERHIAYHFLVDVVASLVILVMAVLTCAFLLLFLFTYSSPDSPYPVLVLAALVAMFVTYAFVTPKSLPGLSWLRRAQDAAPIPHSPFSVGSYFGPGLGLLAAIYWAPLLFHMALEEFRLALAIKRIDRRAAVAALRLLAERDSRVQWYEFEQSLPTIPLETLQRQLRLLQGVVFLRNEPQGCTLTDSCRDEIRAA